MTLLATDPGRGAQPLGRGAHLSDLGVHTDVLGIKPALLQPPVGRRTGAATMAASEGDAAAVERRQRARSARCARRAKYGAAGDRAICLRAHASASATAGGPAELARRGHAAAAAAAGGAEELSRRAVAARLAGNPLGSTGVAIQRGIGRAIASGKYTKYPGVRFRQETGVWRVQFKHTGQLHTVGQCVPAPANARLACPCFATAGCRNPCVLCRRCSMVYLWLYLDAEVLVLPPLFLPQNSVFVGCRSTSSSFGWASSACVTGWFWHLGNTPPRSTV